MPFYRNILKQALRLTWRNKYLWWFGVFAFFLGNGGELEILSNTSNTMNGDPGGGLFPAWQRIASTGLFSLKTFANIGNLLVHDTLNTMFFLIITLLILAVSVFFVWVVIVSQAAIVNNSAALLNNKKSATLRDGLNSGVLNFWPVLFINIIVKIAVNIIMAVAVILPVIFFSASPGVILFYIIVFIITLILAITLSFIGKYAVAFVVINKAKLIPAIKQGWGLFKENWLVSLEMAVILFIINLLVSVVILLAILALAVPFLFLGLMFYYSFSILASWVIAFSALACFLFIAWTGGAALAVFQITSWTSLFLELNKKRGISKLVRIVNSLVK